MINNLNKIHYREKNMHLFGFGAFLQIEKK